MKSTLRELYDLYLPIYREDRSGQVRKNYKYNMEKYIFRYIGDRDVSDITPTEAQMLLNKMKGMGETPIRSVYGDLVLILHHAYMDGLICKDIATVLHKPKCLKGGMRRALTPEERDAVITVAQTKRKYYAYLFMILCGCRPSEAFDIEKEDIDFENETVHIRGTKTRASDRTIPCPRIILDLVKNSPYGAVTVSESGLKVSKECMVRVWHSFFIDCHQYLGGKMYRNAPCEPYPFGKDLVPYNLRHEYCTELARQGVDLRITQKLMGHASPEMTLRVYTNLSDQDICSDKVKEIVNNLQGLHHG